MLVDNAPFQFELDHGDRLVHLGEDGEIFLLAGPACRVHLGVEHRAWVVGVLVHRESGQRHKVDAIALLESVHVTVAEGVAEHVGYAAVVACAGSHPERVVIAPLDVVVLVSLERVHDDVGALAAVVDVAEDVQRIDAQTLDHVADGDDEFIGLSAGDDCLHHARVVHLFVFLRRSLVEQLLDDIGEFRRERLAHLGAGVLRRHCLKHLYQTVERDVVEIVKIFLFLGDQVELLLRIIDQRAELRQFRVAHGVAVDLMDLALDIARRVLEDMAESLVLAVEVGHEMLRPFGEVENCLEVDDFRRGRLDAAEILRQQLEHAPVAFYLFRREARGCVKIVFHVDFRLRLVELASASTGSI